MRKDLIGSTTMTKIRAAFIRWLNRHLRNRFSCAYCGKVLKIQWRWQKITPVKCDCKPTPAQVAEVARQQRAQQKKEEKLRRRGTRLTTTANFCLVDGKRINRVKGQVALYCSKRCRLLRHNTEPRKGGRTWRYVRALEKRATMR